MNVERIERALAELEWADRQATPAPWWRGWDEGADTDTDPATALCIAQGKLPDGSLVLAPLLVADEDHDKDAAGADLHVAEVARNTLPTFIKLARAALALQRADELHHALQATRFPEAEVSLAAQGAVKAYDELMAALAELPDSVLPAERDEAPS